MTGKRNTELYIIAWEMSLWLIEKGVKFNEFRFMLEETDNIERAWFLSHKLSKTVARKMVGKMKTIDFKLLKRNVVQAMKDKK